jgi:hypothetical protein
MSALTEHAEKTMEIMYQYMEMRNLLRTLKLHHESQAKTPAPVSREYHAKLAAAIAELLEK